MFLVIFGCYGILNTQKETTGRKYDKLKQEG